MTNIQRAVLHRLSVAKRQLHEARVYRSFKTWIELGVTVACAFLFGGFVLHLLGWHAHSDYISTGIRLIADVLAAPFSLWSHTTSTSGDYQFVPSYLMAALVYIVMGILATNLIKHIGR
ncbi:MAG: hypothetical protein H7Y22_05245 [Gemmatimonadaceae bacterium]|nr:hypothetical protein [Gloeobacterales cyanobacterium ES-bin-141]